MRGILKLVAVAAVFFVIVVAACLCWFYFYSRDLPNFAVLAKFAPDADTTLADMCTGTLVRLVPYVSLGKNVQDATRAAEGENEDTLALQLSRSLFCESPRILKRHLLEYKASVQLRRRFTSEQLITIYLNRAHFGNELIGVESASFHYYRKHASELDIPQAALIAGLIKAPNLYSPERHPDRAKQRRDAIIDAMLKNGNITAEQARAAEQTALQ